MVVYTEKCSWEEALVAHSGKWLAHGLVIGFPTFPFFLCSLLHSFIRVPLNHFPNTQLAFSQGLLMGEAKQRQ